MAPAPKLGRRHHRDLRDLDYLMRAARPQAFEAPPEQLPPSRHYSRGPILDQGNTGCCTAFSLVAKLAGAPIVVRAPRLPDPFALYDAEVKVDEFSDNDDDTERQMGSTIRAGAKVLQQQGLIDSYHWAYSSEEVLQWILSGQGGVVLGIDWYDWMFQPTAEGIIRRPPGHGARLAGGHAIYCFGADRTLGVVDLQNSWGADWGGWKVNGRRSYAGCCRLPIEELDRLFRGNAEACTILEHSRRARKAAA